MRLTLVAWRRALLAPICLVVLSIFALCSDEDSPTDPGAGGGNGPPAGAVAISISPANATLDAGGTQSFTATVTGTTNAGVTWQASGGTLSGSGASITYTAPVEAGNYTVTATSAADPSKSAAASVTVRQVQVSVDPGEVILEPGTIYIFTATVTKAANTDVTWEVTCGELDVDGEAAAFTAPMADGECTITVASVLAPSVTATARIIVESPYDFTVNTTDDEDDGDCDASHCSLREAIRLANLAIRPAASDIGPTTIGFAPSLVEKTITLTHALEPITTEVSIVGFGADRLTIDAASGPGDRRRVFTITNGADVEIYGLTVTGGSVEGEAGGGGILVRGAGTRATLDDVGIVGNHAFGGNGGGLLVADLAEARVRQSTVQGNSARNGGGIAAWGNQPELGSVALTVELTKISENEAVESGGGVMASYADAVLTATTLSGNHAGTYGGGAAFHFTTGSLSEVVVEENEARTGGGGSPTGSAGSRARTSRPGTTSRAGRAAASSSSSR